MSVRWPWDLDHASMPFLELVVIAGAVWAFVHAWRRWRRDGDAVALSLWFAALVYLAVVEPPLYFPDSFGLTEHVGGVIFSHNVFTVQFMHDRLPLYIVALYPTLATLAYELVRGLGIVARRGPVAAGVATAFVCQVFYEIFDHLGPGLGWWSWNLDNDVVNAARLDAVPLNSMLLFASVSFGAMVWLALKLVDGRMLNGWSLAWRTVVVGVLAPLSMVVAGAPSGAFRDDVEVQRVILWIEIGAVWAVGLFLLVEAWRSGGQRELSSFGRWYPLTYLVVLMVIALASTDEVSAPWYVALCFVASVAVLGAASRTTRRRLPGARTSHLATDGREPRSPARER